MNPGAIAVSIPVVAIVMGIGIGMLAIWTEHKRKAQLLEQYHKERLVALEKGLPLPELDRRLVALDESAPPNSARAFRNGLMMLLIGVILFFALDELVGERVSLFGLIPAAVGVANLVYGVLLLRKEKATNDLRPGSEA
jgi:hypothetical protein